VADRLQLCDIEADCRIGVTEQERSGFQKLLISIELPIDARRASRSDRMEDAVDYARIVDQTRAFCRSRSFHLIETLAEQLAQTILQDNQAAAVQVSVKKRALEGVGYAAVVLERRRAPVALRRAKRAGR